ncbi:MAG: hypothetical protein JSR78_07555, partial [Proteobacteria bacterium]|nr:hypothetical protein [Pseudomonadota bacterium]
MAEAEVSVVVRAREQGFERVAEEAQKLEAALKRFGDISRKAFAPAKANFFAGFQRDFAKAEETLAAFRKSMQSLTESGSIFGSGFAKAMRTGLTEAIGGSALTETFRERGTQLGEAIAAGIRSALNAPGVISPPALSPPAGGSSSGAGGGNGGGSGRSRGGSPNGRGGHDTLGTVITGGVLAQMGVEGAKSLFENAGAMAQVRAQLRSQGMSDVEIADIEETARPISSRYRATSVPRLLQQYGEYRTVFANPEEAKAFLPIGAQVDLGLKNLQAAEDWAKVIDPEQAQLEIAKAVEMKGDAMNPAKARADVDAMLKAIAAFKGQILPSDF